MKEKIIFPAEWHPQSGVQLTWPHERTDWAPILEEATACFVALAREIAKRETLLIVCANEADVRRQLNGTDPARIICREMQTNDTWARDHGGITVFVDGKPVVCDFVFNGWGMKYAAHHDNLITRFLSRTAVFNPEVDVADLQPFVLEGGSLETDGKGTLLTTTRCLLSANRNEYLNKEQLERHLKDFLGIERTLWLTNGYLAGDDTDGHIDTLARFCDAQTIAYVQCTDKTDEHFASLQAMEAELKAFRTADGQPYRLIPLPMADAVLWEGERLPATYANFLIINGAVLVPFYKSDKDEIAKKLLQEAFPDREIVGIDCRTLIKQHGSLHCVTMQYPAGVLSPPPAQCAARPCTTGHPANASAEHPANASAGRPANETTGRPASEPARHPANALTAHPANETVGHTASDPFGHPTSDLAGHPANASAKHPASNLAGRPTSDPAWHPASDPAVTKHINYERL